MSSTIVKKWSNWQNNLNCTKTQKKKVQKTSLHHMTINHSPMLHFTLLGYQQWKNTIHPHLLKNMYRNTQQEDQETVIKLQANPINYQWNPPSDVQILKFDYLRDLSQLIPQLRLLVTSWLDASCCALPWDFASMPEQHLSLMAVF